MERRRAMRYARKFARTVLMSRIGD